MPLIEIHAPPQPDAVDRAAICSQVNEAVAAAIPCRLEAVWAVWRTIDGPFLKGNASADESGAPFGPIVHVYHHRTPEHVARAVAAIEGVLARELRVEPGDVFVTTQPVEVELPRP